MKKAFIAIVVLIFLSNAEYSQVAEKERIIQKSFELDVKIDNLSRNFAGCGILNYTLCVAGVPNPQILGKKVLLYFDCPEVLNSLPTGNNYRLDVTYYTKPYSEGLIVGAIQDSSLTKLKVISVKKVW